MKNYIILIFVILIITLTVMDNISNISSGKNQAIFSILIL